LELGVRIEIGASTFSQQSTPAEIGVGVPNIIQHEEPQLMYSVVLQSGLLLLLFAYLAGKTDSERFLYL
jgi:hypothetical protein